MNKQTVHSTEWKSLVEILRWRATHQSERLAYTFLLDGEEQAVHLSYGQLDHLARTIGAKLQSLGAKGQRALLLYPASLEYIAAFFGSLYAGSIAVPTYPPEPTRLDRTLPRLQAIINDAQPMVVLTTSQILAMAQALSKHTPDLQKMQWVAIDTIAGDLAGEWQEPGSSRDTLAFLQYTSGSTASPKGVMVSHGNIINNEQMLKAAFEGSEETTWVSWLPLFHDMGLIGGALQPFYNGAHCILMSPLHFLQRPLRWLNAIVRHQARVSGGPNFAYDLCVRKIKPEQAATLDLSGWEIAFNGAEPVRHDTLERFAQTFKPCGFRRESLYPCYGLAEATLFVSGGLKASPPVYHTVQGTALEHGQMVTAGEGEADSRTLVGCGRTWLDENIAIVDPDSLIACPDGQIGEIWITGPHVAQGYWSRSEESKRTFQAQLAGKGSFLRTGDLGFLKNGEVFIAGRIKDLIIIDGRNHYPQDVELTVEQSHPLLRPGCSAAFSIDVNSQEQLVLVAEIRDHKPDSIQPDLKKISQDIKRAVAEYHDVRPHDIVLIKAGSIPKTSSGKIQRRACRADYLAKKLDVI